MRFMGCRCLSGLLYVIDLGVVVGVRVLGGIIVIPLNSVLIPQRFCQPGPTTWGVTASLDLEWTPDE